MKFLVKLWLAITINFGLFPILSGNDLSPDFGEYARYPNTAKMENGNLLISWLEPGLKDTFHIKISQYDGLFWSSPKKVLSADNLFVNWADFPTIFPLGGNKLVVNWLQYAGSGVYEYDVHLKISEDMGKTWSEDLVPHSDGKLAEHGFVSFFKNPNGTHGLVWLDGRNMVENDESDNMGNMALYTTSITSDYNFEKDYPLDEMVCECCSTSALTFNDRVIISYRNREEDELRNIHLLKYENDRWKDMGAIHNDGWKIPGCPVNGPAMAALNDKIGIAWFTAPGGEPQINFITTSDIGNSFSSPIQLNEKAALGRVDLITFDGNFLISWIEIDDENCNLVLKKVSNKGDQSPKYLIDEISCDRSSGYPKMEVFEKRLFVTWTVAGAGIETRWIDLVSLLK